ncbi:GDP-mannose 4,6-dehydratase [Paenibacillus sp. MCAF9]|uniref:GDP-mannose 4,6-dehydratase n=1 Tax=Paenibacillus sp. MCAF9 TaxID=3233046 RepID=UPI003F994484
MIEKNSRAALTALVTGAMGFIGSHLVRKLLAEEWKVHIIARNESSLKQLEDVQGAIIIHRPQLLMRQNR